MPPVRRLPPLNNSMPFKAVRLNGVGGQEGRVGVFDEVSKRVWVGHDLESQQVPLDQIGVIDLPTFPVSYGSWECKPIGGVSYTVRRVGILTARGNAKAPFIIFATHISQDTDVWEKTKDAIGPFVQFGDTVQDDEFGFACEIIVYQARNVSFVCSRIDAAGAKVIFEDTVQVSEQPIGIERLDRVQARVVTTDDMYPEEDDHYGSRRGFENWPGTGFLPEDWKLPFSWDDMVENVSGVEESCLPPLLRQHVVTARHRSPLDVPRRESRVEDAAAENLGIGGGTGGGIVARHKNPVSLPKSRLVSATLEIQQAKQLIEAFFFLYVVGLENATQKLAFELIMFQYLKERGMLARWIGQYKQSANHVGNGHAFRNFRTRLSQYRKTNLPSMALNRLCGADGRLRTSGAMGSRSKYKHDKPRYVPSKRLMQSKKKKPRETYAGSSS